MLNFPDTRLRASVFNSVKVKFPTIDSAEEFYNLTLSNCLEEMETPGSRGNTSPKIMVDKVAQTEKTALKDIYKNWHSGHERSHNISH